MEGLSDGVRDRGRVQIITIGHTTWYLLERKKKHFTEPFSTKMVKSKLPRPDTLLHKGLFQSFSTGCSELIVYF